MNLAKRLERLEHLYREKGRLGRGPLYCSRRQDEDETAALDRLVAAGKIRETDRDRVTLLVRVMIDPPETGAAPVLGDVTTPAITGPCGRDEASKKFYRPIEYQPSGIV
jgi:hypothetical protein